VGQTDAFEQGGRPGHLGDVIRRNPQTGERHLDKLVWGLLPHDTRDPLGAPRPIHARAKTVQELPMFADAFRRRRAIVPADTYNLRATKGDLGARFVVSRADGNPMAWAGIWESYVWPGGRIERTYCVITVDANGLVAPWHDRMPLVLEPEDWELWLGDVEGDPAALLRPVTDDVLMLRPIGKKAPDRR
jgi:putative SOS response-associated peptidase YedK